MPAVADSKWNERTIGLAIFNKAFARKHVVLMANTYWTGHEADVLIVRNDLRLMDIEIKVSRSDFRADQHKDKWWKYGPYPQGYYKDGRWMQPECARERREWPVRIWKHYYCLPKEIWLDELKAEVSPKSGILLMSEDRHGNTRMDVHRQAKPNPVAKAISVEDGVDIARLCNMRMWAAIEAQERMYQDSKRRAEAIELVGARLA